MLSGQGIYVSLAATVVPAVHLIPAAAMTPCVTRFKESIDEIRRAVDELCAYQVCGILIHLPLQVDLRDLQDLCRNVPLVAVDSDFGY